MLTEGSLEKINRCSMEFEEVSLVVEEIRVHIVRLSFPNDLQEKRSRWLPRGQMEFAINMVNCNYTERYDFATIPVWSSSTRRISPWGSWPIESSTSYPYGYACFPSYDFAIPWPIPDRFCN